MKSIKLRYLCQSAVRALNLVVFNKQSIDMGQQYWL